VNTSAPLQLDALKGVDPKTAKTIIGIVSVVALLVLVVVIYGHGRTSLASEPAWVSWLPVMDAIFNGTSALFLVAAYVAVRSRKFALHAKLMLVSLASSACFLVSYIVYHSLHGDTLFQGQGAIRPIYFFILISHIGLSAVVLPLIFSSFYFSLSGRFPPHKKVSRYTLPIWLYVSVTGVVVFFMLRAYA
jgi:putative membrane protein